MESAALEQRLRDHPGDLAAWHAYGDRLLEQGDARGTLIRLEQRRARVRPADRKALEREIAALAEKEQRGWDAALPQGVTVLERRYGFAAKVAVEWSEDAPALIEEALRGRFVTALQITPPVGDDDDVEEDWEEAWAEHDGEPFPSPPVEAGAFATLDLGRLVELDLSYFPLGTPGAEALAAATGKGRIETLDLRYCGLGDAGLAALAAAPDFGGVRRLRLQRNRLSAEGVRPLWSFERLTALDLRYNRIGEKGTETLLAAPFIGSLTELHLIRADVTAAGVTRLALAPQLAPALRNYWRSV
ncbi:hypothetical protein [Spirillospora sp. NBC_01491]|uniref:hypothetical protein n=1 Tax=Spirillospora sp. NBC_01491 TaxID=2976007 RepID=UPI002E35E8F7|nr:hypothetical protein [Spirillospora sp. NBC_01491]